MKSLEKILKRHDKEMLIHNKIFLAGRASKDNPKVFQQTMNDIKDYVIQEIERLLRETRP